MPYFGLGVFKFQEGDELQTSGGIRIICRVQAHRYSVSLWNERGVGQAIKESGVPRKDIFVTSKIWNSDQDMRMHCVPLM